METPASTPGLFICIHKSSYKREKPFVITFFALLLAGIALFQLKETPLLSLIMGIFSTAIFTFHYGIEVDFKNNKYRHTNLLLFLRFGNWQPIPTLKYISVFKANVVSSIAGFSGKVVDVHRKTVLQVNLITHDNKRLKLLETQNPKEAFEFASKVAPQLDLQIWDATTKKSNWFFFEH